MSTQLTTSHQTPTQRITEAMRRASAELGLADTKALTAVLLEAAAEELEHNSAFADRVRRRLDEAPPAARKRAPSKIAPPDIDLVPLKLIEGRVANPAFPPDPYFLYDLYGSSQLALALSRYTLKDLQLAAVGVQQRNPGTKPANKVRRDAVIDYIVRYVAGESAVN